MKKKMKLFVMLGALALLAAIILVVNSQPNEYEKNFEDNGANKPYARKVPLHEMDFNEYDYYFQYIQGLGSSINYVREIELPCDINYYVRKEDSKPALTLKKGTKVYVKPKDFSEHEPVGYGWRCWPDYEKGWRYGYAFVTEDFKLYEFELVDEDAEMYYVKLDQLEKVAEAFYKANKDVLSKGITKKMYIENFILSIDKTLYMNGAYLSNELRELR